VTRASEFGISAEARPAGVSRSRRPFRLVAYVLAVTALGAGLPTPLYPVYQERFHFSAGTLGVVFGAYAVGVILTMFFVAPLSDTIGRKPLLHAGMVLTAISAVLFIFSTGVLWLAAARVVSGLAVGATTSTATAAMTALEPFADQHHVARVSVASNFGGVASGILISGFLVQYAPDPTVLVFLLLIVASAIGILAVSAIPETVANVEVRSPFHVQRVRVPTAIERSFWVAVGGLTACYSIYGLYAALAPGYLRVDLLIQGSFETGLFIAVMFGSAAVVQLALAQVRDRRALLFGFPLIVGGLILTLASLTTASGLLWVLGAALLGVGVGFAFMGATTLVDRVAPESVRGDVLSGFYVTGYLALAVPTIGVGIAVDQVGLTTAGLVFGIALILFVIILFGATWRTPTPPGGEGRPRSAR
jgi:MFS family permease